MLIERQAIEEWIQDVGESNYQIEAYGISVDGPVRPTFTKKWNPNNQKHVTFSTPNGSIPAGTALDRAYKYAATYMKADDPVRAIDALVECKWITHVYLSPLDYVAERFPIGDRPNPYREVERLIWKRDPEDEQKIETRGGAREGSGRKHRNNIHVSDDGGKTLRKLFLHLKETRQSVELNEDALVEELIKDASKQAGLE